MDVNVVAFVITNTLMADWVHSTKVNLCVIDR